MPKVGTKEFKIKGVNQKFNLYYSPKEGFYLKNFPSDVYSLTETTAWYKTEAALMDSTHRALYNYHKIIEAETRVILISIAAPTGKVMNKSDYGHYVGDQKWIGDFGDRIKHVSSIEVGGANGFGFLIGYRVCLKVESNGFEYYDIRNTHTPEDEPEKIRRKTHKKREEIEIVWTEENEAFFKKLESNIDSMFEQIVNFFRQPQELLLANMSKFLTGNNLLTDSNNTDGSKHKN
jgi:hypothetical protein